MIHLPNTPLAPKPLEVCQLQESLSTLLIQDKGSLHLCTWNGVYWVYTPPESYTPILNLVILHTTHP